MTHKPNAIIPQVSDIQRAWHALAACAVGIIPARIYGEADQADALNLIDDLKVLARHVDALILAYGLEARSNFNGVDVKQFENVLSGALEGFAFHELEFAGERKHQDMLEEAS